jgi:secreted trypsin-like serine protease
MMLLVSILLIGVARAFELKWTPPEDFRQAPADIFNAVHDLESRKHSNRVVGGGNVNPPDRFPYYAYLEVRTDGGSFICSATLIWEDILLTAAHCLVDLQLAGLELLGVDAWVGLSDQDQRDAAVYRQVELAVPNPRFDPNTEENDIMIMKLVDPITEIQPVLLNFDPSVPVNNQALELFGFGTTSENATTLPTILQTAQVNVVPFNTCNAPGAYNGNINNNLMICAAAPGVVSTEVVRKSSCWELKLKLFLLTAGLLQRRWGSSSDRAWK